MKSIFTGKGRILMDKKKKIIIGLIVVLIAGLGYFFYHLYQQNEAEKASKELTLNGNVDVREVSLSFRQSDRIAQVLVDEGDKVKAGQVLAKLDNKELDIQIQEAQAKVAAQQSTVDKLHNGTRDEELHQAEQKVEAAKAESALKQSSYERIQALYDQDAVSAQERDNYRSAADAANAQTKEAEEALQQAISGPRSEDVAGGEASLQAAQAELDRLVYLRSQYDLVAPSDGVIRSRLKEAGDMASASTPIFKMSLLDKKWVRVYVKEADLGKIYEGMKANVIIDSYPDKPITGQIGYISSTAEFTPKAVQTNELRTSLVYEVRVYVDDADNLLRLGMPATVKIEL